MDSINTGVLKSIRETGFQTEGHFFSGRGSVDTLPILDSRKRFLWILSNGFEGFHTGGF